MAPYGGTALKFVRIFFFYALLFFISLIIAAIFFGPGNEGFLVLFSFIASGLFVWWYVKRRARRLAAKARAQPEAVEHSTIRSRSVAATASTPPSRMWDQPRPSVTAPTVNPVRLVAPPPAVATRHQGWAPKGQVVTVHGQEIGGMVYVGTPPTLDKYGYGEKCRAYIDPSLPVAPEGNDKAGAGMSYWPGYSTIPSECRATYLEWLARGATDGSYNPGYMFLYFYGLERRYFVDRPEEQEKKDIMAEVQRLLDVYSDNRSAQRYLRDFIDIAVSTSQDFDTLAPVFDNPGWDVPFSVKLAIGARLQKGETLSADWVLSWFLCHPEKNLRTSAKRCRDEFIALFRLRFYERFPQGMKVAKPRPALKVSYQAASREFDGTVEPTRDGKPIPDISSLRKPIEIAQEIADAVMEDLEKFSRYLGRNREGRGSVEAHALLPEDLRRLFPSEELEKIRVWAVAVVLAGGLVPVGDVLERLEGEL